MTRDSGRKTLPANPDAANAPKACFGTLYQRLSPRDLGHGLPPSLSMAVGVELYFADPADCLAYVDNEVKSAAQILNEHRMVRTYHGPPFMADFTRNESQRRENHGLQTHALQQAILLGARKYVLYSPFTRQWRSGSGENAGGTIEAEPFAAVVAEIDALLSMARDNNIQIVLENHGERTPEIFARVADRFADPTVGFCLDVANLHRARGQPPAAWFRALGSRLTHVHLSDIDGHSEDPQPLGTGTVNLEPLAEVLARTGHAPTACLETPLPSMISSMAALEKAGLAWGADERGL